MKQFMSGTSAVEISEAGMACWNLHRMDASCYELRPQGAADAQAAEVLLRVISSVLEGAHVGVIAESTAGGLRTLTGLSRIWRDGRVLKRDTGSAFVALDGHFSELDIEAFEPCVGAGTAFRFLCFAGHATEEAVFRSLIGERSDAVLELSCRDLADGVLTVRFDAEAVDEGDLLRDISHAVGCCGCLLEVAL